MDGVQWLLGAGLVIVVAILLILRSGKARNNNKGTSGTGHKSYSRGGLKYDTSPLYSNSQPTRILVPPGTGASPQPFSYHVFAPDPQGSPAPWYYPPLPSGHPTQFLRTDGQERESLLRVVTEMAQKRGEKHEGVGPPRSVTILTEAEWRRRQPGRIGWLSVEYGDHYTDFFYDTQGNLKYHQYNSYDFVAVDYYPYCGNCGSFDLEHSGWEKGPQHATQVKRLGGRGTETSYSYVHKMKFRCRKCQQTSTLSDEAHKLSWKAANDFLDRLSWKCEVENLTTFLEREELDKLLAASTRSHEEIARDFEQGGQLKDMYDDIKKEIYKEVTGSYLVFNKPYKELWKIVQWT